MANASLRTLDPDLVRKTVTELESRINERFVDSSLSRLCNELEQIAIQAKERSIEISRPLVGVRILVGAGLCLLLGITLYTTAGLKLPDREFGLTEVVQILDSLLNDIVIIGAVIVSMITFETRIKRRRALLALNDLRSVAHIIDMHQLTKDPQRLARTATRTRSSPEEQLNRFLLGRYLDYCSEMLALTGKIAALYIDRFSDPVVLTTVNEIEALTTGLSQKIWQKLIILESLPD